MNGDRFGSIVGSIVTIGLVTTVLMRGTQAAQVIGSFGGAFAQSITAAQGRN